MPSWQTLTWCSRWGPSSARLIRPAKIRPLLDARRQSFVQIDIEPRHAAWTFPADLVLHGDAAEVLEQLCSELARRAAAPANGVARAAEAHRHYASFRVPESSSESSPILPQRLIAELEQALPDDAIVTCDAGENRLFMLHFFRTRAGMEYLQPVAVGGMGYAVPAALAARLVYPDRASVAVCGDGGFGIGLNGMLTAVEEQIPIVVVVLNNSALGWVRDRAARRSTHRLRIRAVRLRRDRSGHGCAGPARRGSRGAGDRDPDRPALRPTHGRRRGDVAGRDFPAPPRSPAGRRRSRAEWWGSRSPSERGPRAVASKHGERPGRTLTAQDFAELFLCAGVNP